MLRQKNLKFKDSLGNFETQPENREHIVRELGPGSGAESIPGLPTCPA